MKILSYQAKPFHELRYRSSGPKGRPRKCVLPFVKVYVDRLPEQISAIAVASDLQGRESGRDNRLLGEAVAEELLMLQEVGEIPPIDAVLLAGDLYDYPDLRKLGGTGDTTWVWNAFARHFPMAIGVLGNHDTVVPEKLAPSAIVLDGNSTQLGDLTISGVSGIIGRSSKNQRKTASAFGDSLLAAIARPSDLVILHQGPDLPERQQIGEPLIREILETGGEGLVIFGHCHWREPLAKIGGFQVLNVDSRVCVFLSAELEADRESPEE